jgi:hypothetical protein
MEPKVLLPVAVKRSEDVEPSFKLPINTNGELPASRVWRGAEMSMLLW